jgi:hypothetical protein
MLKLRDVVITLVVIYLVSATLAYLPCWSPHTKAIDVTVVEKIGELYRVVPAIPFETPVEWVAPPSISKPELYFWKETILDYKLGRSYFLYFLNESVRKNSLVWAEPYDVRASNEFFSVIQFRSILTFTNSPAVLLCLTSWEGIAGGGWFYLILIVGLMAECIRRRVTVGQFLLVIICWLLICGGLYGGYI